MDVLERKRLLDPIDRISETLFGLIMAVTIVGAQSIATSGEQAARALFDAAFGCNIAWGLVDAVMYLVRTSTERTHNRAIGRRAARADADTARRLIAESLPPHVAAITGPEELEGMRRRLAALRTERRALAPRDFLEAAGVFLLVVLSTCPVVLPFLLTSDMAKAKDVSRVVALVMLFLAGLALGRYAGHAKPLVTGLAMAGLGAALIAAVIVLGG